MNMVDQRGAQNHKRKSLRNMFTPNWYTFALLFMLFLTPARLVTL